MDSLLSLAAQEACTGAQMIQSECTFYHYHCDGISDKGWGCGYRSLQSMCSWVVEYKQKHGSFLLESSSSSKRELVPSIPELQACLVEVGDKPPSFAGSKEWIGCYEACIVLDHLYGVSSKILHVPSGSGVVKIFDELSHHFQQIGSPAMIGGDVDGASKTLIGVCLQRQGAPQGGRHSREKQFLIADPHYSRESDDPDRTGCKVSWYSMELFEEQSFYNFCLPQLPSVGSVHN